jgi:hypothetical protein
MNTTLSASASARFIEAAAEIAKAATAAGMTWTPAAELTIERGVGILGDVDGHPVSLGGATSTLYTDLGSYCSYGDGVDVSRKVVIGDLPMIHHDRERTASQALVHDIAQAAALGTAPLAPVRRLSRAERRAAAQG